MKKLFLFFAVIFCISLNALKAQDIPAKPTMIITGKFVGESKPLRDYPIISKEDYHLMETKAIKKRKNTPWPLPQYPFSSTALPIGEDAVWQKAAPLSSGGIKAPIQFFEGQSSPYYPPDCNGAAGPNHYMQTVNSSYAIYSKTGTLLASNAMNTLFGNVPGANYNDGDPIILYDEQANRWVAVEFSVSGSNDYMLFAVSTTNDPTGTWYQYSFDVVDMPDYEKVAVWPDGYYMGTNTQPTTGNDIYVFERSQMLVGGTARMVAFDNPYRPGTGVVVVPPVDNDGPAAPAGTPGTFIAFNDDGVGGGADELWLYELAVNWTTPASSTFNRTQQLPVSPFDSQFNNGWDNITQPGTTMKLCAISTVIMNVPQYRNFGTHQSIVCCHTVDVGTDHAGVRWYELRKTPPATNWVLRQQGTYAPDAHSRWMGSISMNADNRIAIGYSISSSTEYPGIRYTGQSTAGYNSASGLMDVPEVVAHTGTNYQYSYNRWGDYSSMAVDPTDDQTFWFTTEYIGASEARKTKIFSFKIGNAPVVSAQNATLITGSSATLNGDINPNGLATNYYFEWGLTTAYGNTTTTTSAGSGMAGIPVSANISGLTVNSTYHFRVVAVNSDGTSYSNDMLFIAGGATLTTTAASSIGLTTATSGGNISADGGSPIIARGVCWGTTANPTISGGHTTDGSGIGAFTSSITGLSSSTTYHIRAYATNANGTFYGDNLTFTTQCGIFTLPFTESFANTTIPNCWSIIDNQGGGQNWQFGTITGQSPNPILTGNYAYLNSDAYGSGNTQNSDLVSPTLNLTTYGTVTLQFSYYFKSYAGSSGNLYYSTNNGSTWTIITSFTTTSATNPVIFNQTVNAVAGQPQVKFKWNYTGTYGYYWAVDEISITGTAASIPVVTTTAVTNITQNTATSGGNVTSGGTSAVTARGVCWGTTINPTLSNSFTNDGSGVGVFTSNLSGLSAYTTYYIRAYATNSSGTGYGDNLTFSTGCSSISTFPWNEGFENAGTIPSCWSQEYVTTPGLNWTFVTGNGGSQPATAHGGTYNACLKDNTSADNKTKLITPSLNLTSISSPTLTFWHTQALWSPDQDQLIVYYKSSASGSWTLLQSYTTSETAWTQRTIALPNQSNDYYIAFEGNAKYGYGVCVDDVVVSGGCSLPGNAGTISGLTTVCQGQSSVVYTVPTISGATNYIWTLPSGASGSSSTNSITVSYGISAVSGNITVKGNNTCGDGNLSSLAITVNPLPSEAGSITGTPAICQGAGSVSYSVGSITNATSYLWAYSGTGATISGTTNNITITFDANATSGNLTVNGVNSCGNGTISSNYPITVSPLPQSAGSISGAPNVCLGSTSIAYSVPVISDATSYVWAYTGTGASINGSSNNVTITFASNATSGNLTVYGTNSCGNGTISANYSVTVNPLPATVNVSGGGTFCGNAVLTASNGNDGSIYFQNTTTNGTSTSVPGNIQTVTGSGTYYFRAQSSAGCWGTQGSASVTINPLPVITSFTATPADICLGTTSSLSATANGALNNFTASAASGTINVSIPESVSGATYSLPITTGAGNVSAATNIQVTLSITHAYDSDLDIFLIGPGNCGTMLLSTDNGGTGDHYTNTVLSTSATNIIGSSGNNTAPFTGTYRPEGTIITPPVLTGGFNSGTYSLPATSLNGCPVNGSWTLFVADDRYAAVGNLTKFEIILSGSGGNFTHQFSGNGNIGSVNYDGSNNQTGSATVSNIPAGSNSYNVITTAPNGCSVDSTLFINANTPSVAPTLVTATATDICVGTQLTLTQSGGILGTNAFWQWYTDAAFSQPLGTPVYTPDASLTLTPTATATYFIRAEGTSAPCQGNVGDNSKSVTVTIHEMPNSGTLTKFPDESVICGSNVYAVLTPGTGGAGTINDVLEYSYDGLVWNPYISGAAISTTGYPSVQIRTFRTSSVSGCDASTPNVVSWLIAEPYNLSATNIYNNSADLTWSDDNGSQWNIQYGLQGFTLGTGTVVSGILSMNYQLVGLNPATDYSCYVQSDCGGQSSSWVGPYNFTTDNSQSKTLNLKVYLEGLYDANGLMRQAQNANGPEFGAGIADRIKVELHSANNYSSIVYELSNVDLTTTGNTSIAIPGLLTATYYITVKHRNSIETVSSTAISFSNSVINYDFTTSAGKAYGNNQKSVSGGYYAMYASDVNQDGIVDGSDMALTFNSSLVLLQGYILEDINGDGLVDGSDIAMAYNNVINLVGKLVP